MSKLNNENIKEISSLAKTLLCNGWQILDYTKLGIGEIDFENDNYTVSILISEENIEVRWFDCQKEDSSKEIYNSIDEFKNNGLKYLQSLLVKFKE